MNNSFSRLMKYALSIGAIAMVIFTLISKPNDFSGWAEYVSYSTSIATAFAFLYEKWLWKWNPLEKMPQLKNKYDGTLHYRYNGTEETKPIKIEIDQSLLKVKVKTRTDMSSSSTVMGMIIEENGEHVLYYSYITNPDITVTRDNPMQYGTCRMELNRDNVQISGHYWTNRMTAGDMTWIVR